MLQLAFHSVLYQPALDDRCFWEFEDGPLANDTYELIDCKRTGNPLC